MVKGAFLLKIFTTIFNFQNMQKRLSFVEKDSQ